MTENLPPLPVTKLSIPSSSSCIHKFDYVSYEDIAVITKSSIKVNYRHYLSHHSFDINLLKYVLSSWIQII